MVHLTASHAIVTSAPYVAWMRRFGARVTHIMTHRDPTAAAPLPSPFRAATIDAIKRHQLHPRVFAEQSSSSSSSSPPPVAARATAEGGAPAPAAAAAAGGRVEGFEGLCVTVGAPLLKFGLIPRKSAGLDASGVAPPLVVDDVIRETLRSARGGSSAAAAVGGAAPPPGAFATRPARASRVRRLPAARRV